MFERLRRHELDDLVVLADELETAMEQEDFVSANERTGRMSRVHRGAPSAALSAMDAGEAASKPFREALERLYPRARSAGAE